MALLERRFAAAYDRVLGVSERAGLAAQRRDLLATAAGHVVELGAGTGLNLAAYGPDVTSLTLLEPSVPMAERLRERVAGSAHEVDLVIAPGEAIPLPDATADVVVSTLVLCTVTDLDRALAEIERVLVPTGRLLLLEHVAAEGGTGALQRVLRRPWRVVAQGCDLRRDPRAALRGRGWDTSGLVDVSLPMPAPTRTGQAGVATPP